MKKLIFPILIIFLCIFSFMLISCDGQDDTTSFNSFEYSITYELNGGTNSAENPSGYNKGDKIILDAPQKEGYMFTGWYTEEDILIEINEDTAGDLTLYATWRDIESSLLFELNYLGDSYIVIGCAKSLEYMYIPSTYKGLPVTVIGSYAFMYHKNLKYVYIPDGVTSIWSSAFFSCESLEGVRIPNSVTEIDTRAFSKCKKLKSIDLPDNLTVIGSYLFYYSGITSIDIPDGVTEIRKNAFSDCKSLTNIKLPESLTTLRYDVFLNCTALEEIVIPSSVTNIDKSIFRGCTSLKSITVADGNTVYKSVDGALYTKDGKTLVAYPGGNGEETFTVPNGTENIEVGAFAYNPSLKSVVIPGSVKNFGWRMFNDCTSLESVIIEDGVTAIETTPFYNCDSLKSVVVPDSVTTITEEMLEGCPLLTVYCEAEQKPEGWDENWSNGAKEVVWGDKEGNK